MILGDRFEAGIKLADKIKPQKPMLILAIPRGGVQVGVSLAKKLNVPLDVIVARKLGAPHNPELAIGAVTSEGKIYLDQKLIKELNVDSNYIDSVVEQEKDEAKRREHIFRGRRKKLSLEGKNVIVVDDGIATGATTRAIIEQITGQAKTLTLAVPVLPKELVADFESKVTKLVYLDAPKNFYAVGLHYKNFPQVSDEEVIALLKHKK